MKHFIIVIIVAMLLLSFSFDGLQAQSCNSAAQVIGDIWGKVHDLAVQGGCKLVNKAGYLDYAFCFNKTSKIVDLNSNLIQFWNSHVNNSWATIGPRRLEFDKNLTGTLVSTGGRKFVSFPMLDKNSVTITIDETDGKGKASIVVCKVDPSNQYTKVATKWFNDTKKRKDKTNEHREVVVNGAKNHIIVVHLDGKSVGNTFKYKIRATSN